MKTYVIGDIHGGLKSLKQVLTKSPVKIHNDKIIFLGDYVDGWSESAQLIEFLILLGKNNPNIIFLRGNHDKWCEEWLITGVRHPYWIPNGGQSTVDSYINMGIMPETHLVFFRKLHNYYVDEKNRGFVHGGFVSRKGLGHEAYETNYYWDRDMWTLALMSNNRTHFDEGGISGYRFFKHKEVFIGHTPTENWICKPHYPEFNDINQESKNGKIVVPMKRCNVWNLDTGAGWGGKLTIMNIDSKEYWQSDFVKTLYPNEKGR